MVEQRYDKGIPIDRIGRRLWGSVNDGEIVGYAKRIIHENEIKTRTRLFEVDGALYQILRKRNLLDLVIFPKGGMDI